MLNINFVPDDYVEKRQTYRANIFYLVLLLIVLSVFGGTFLVIKTRQRALLAEAKMVNQKIVQASEAIAQLEQLQSRRKVMMKTALMTAELIEPVPRSLVLAALTNTLPRGVSLTRLRLVEKAQNKAASYGSKYQAAKSQQQTPEDQPKPRTEIKIEGVAPSDIEVAQYIARLGDSVLLEEVGLVHSKEHKIEEENYRLFELTAVLNNDVALSQETVASIKTRNSI